MFMFCFPIIFILIGVFLGKALLRDDFKELSVSNFCFFKINYCVIGQRKNIFCDHFCCPRILFQFLCLYYITSARKRAKIKVIIKIYYSFYNYNNF